MPLHFLLPATRALRLDAPTTGTTTRRPATPSCSPAAEAHHAAAVRRVRVGEEVTVGDGRGTWLTGECESVAPREVVVRITARADIPAPRPRIVLVQALAKGDRDELAVQAATELGVDEIVPWQAARSVSRWDAAKAEKGRARWAAIVREAAKQAHRAWIPDVVAARDDGDAGRAGRGIPCPRPRADARGARSRPRRSPPRCARHRARRRAGGRHRAGGARRCSRRRGRPLVRLGDTVLRTSTAGPAALAVVSAALGRW